MRTKQKCAICKKLVSSSVITIEKESEFSICKDCYLQPDMAHEIKGLSPIVWLWFSPDEGVTLPYWISDSEGYELVSFESKTEAIKWTKENFNEIKKETNHYEN